MSLLNVQYQKRDLDFVDYDMGGARLSSGEFVYFRDMPDGFSLGTDVSDCFSIIGPAFSFGCYTNNSFGKMIENATGLKQLNFSLEGSSPETYLRPDVRSIIEVINRTKFCVITTFSGQSVSNTQFKHGDSLHTYEKLRANGSEKLRPAHALYEEYFNEHGNDEFEKLIKETQDNYVDTSNELYELITTKKILFWFSKRKPSQFNLSSAHKDSDVFGKMGKFPHFIDQKTIDRAAVNVDYHVESVCASGTPQLLFNRWNGEMQQAKNNDAYDYASSKYNMYYASPLMHLDAFEKLIPTVDKILGCKTRTNMCKLQDKDVLKSINLIANELHLAKFFRLNPTLNAYIDEYWFNALGKHYEYQDEKIAPYLPNSIKIDRSKAGADSADDLKFSLTINGSSVDNSDVFAFMLSKSVPFHMYPKFTVEEKKKESKSTAYVILTTPRSGSTMFGTMLSNCGIGKVKEHFRGGASSLLNNDRLYGINREKVIERLIEYGAVNNSTTKSRVFGTKFIAHFIQDIDDDKSVYTDFSSRGAKFLRLIREDKIAQVTSVLRARRSDVWHKYKDESLSFNEADMIDKLTENEVLNAYHSIVAQEDYLDSVVLNLNLPVVQIVYEELLENRDEVMSSVFEFLMPSLTKDCSEKLLKLAKPSTQRISKPREECALYKYIQSILATDEIYESNSCERGLFA